MLTLNWHRNQHSRRSHSAYRSFRPSLEALESRVVPSYVLYKIGPLPDTVANRAVALNDHGQVAGSALVDRPGTKNDYYLGSYWSRETGSIAIPLPTVGTSGFRPRITDINNQGVISVNIEMVGGRFESFVAHHTWAAAQPLGTLPGGGSVEALDINDAGAVVGVTYGGGQNRAFIVTPLDTDGNSKADTWFRDTNGDGANDLMTVLAPPVPGPPGSFASSINAAGQVAGYSEGLVGGVWQTRAVIWENAGGGYVARDLGRFTDAAGVERNSRLTRINAARQAAGGWGDPSGNGHGLFWNGTSLIDLGTLGGSSTGVRGLNDRGQVAGLSLTSSGNHHAFVWDQTSGIRDLGTLGGPTSSVGSINSLGQVVGTSAINDRKQAGRNFGPDEHGFVWDQTSGIRDLNNLITNRGRFEVRSASAINVQGHILATGGDPGYADVLLVPTSGSLVAESASRQPTSETLALSHVEPLLTEAIARWQATGVDTSTLRGIDIRIADLGSATLGLASGNTIWLDDNAAGWGWFVDPTSWDDSEFTTPGNQGEQGRMDLLTVLAHELGHLLGYDHGEPGASATGDVMIDTLATGIRRLPGSTEVNDWSAMLDVLVAEPLSKRRW